MVLGLTGRVANRSAVVMVCETGEKYFARTFADDVGADWHGCEQVCGGDDLRFGRKIFRRYIGWWWGRLTGLRTGYAVVMVCYAGEKYFGCTLGCARGGRAIKYG